MNINKDKALAAMVRSFFEAFSSGIIDSSDVKKEVRLSSKTIKQLMLNHYEHIAPNFFDTMFYPLAMMNYAYEEIEQVVRESQERGDDMMALVRTACASDALYEAMVAEYKRNFSNLLAGKYASADQHLESFASLEQSAQAVVASDVAIRLVVRVAMRAYAAGIRQSTGDMSHFRQATVFWLMLDAMNVLLCDKAADYSDCGDDLSAMFLKVCLNEHNFLVMTEEMDRVHQELMC